MSEEKYPPLNNKKASDYNYKGWEKDTKPKLKEYGKTIVNDKWYNLLKTTLICLIIGIAVVGYMAYDGKFKTEIEIPDCVCPECPTLTCPEIPACPTCSNICDVDFPNSLEITLGNETE